MERTIRNRLLLPAIALILLLVIQLVWLYQSASLQAEIFNQRASYALTRTVDDIRSDEHACKAIAQCCKASKERCCAVVLRESEKKKTDSLLRYYLAKAHLKIDYTFEVLENASEFDKTGSNCYQHHLALGGDGKALMIRLHLPGKTKYVLSEMGLMFLGSVLLLGIVVFFIFNLYKALRRQHQVLRHTKDFVDNMTHELKTPLTNISMAGRMLSGEAVAQDEKKRLVYGNIIRDESEKLREHIERMLQAVCLETDQQPVQLTETDFIALIRSSSESMNLRAREKNISLLTELPDSALMGKADKLLLGGAIVNLIDNAIKYSPENTTVKTEAHRHGHDLVITVSDEGEGIPADQQDLVFEKYYRVPKGDEHSIKGFGLGLFFVKKVVTLHHGHVAISSEPGKGTRITLTIPLNL